MILSMLGLGCSTSSMAQIEHAKLVRNVFYDISVGATCFRVNSFTLDPKKAQTAANGPNPWPNSPPHLTD